MFAAIFGFSSVNLLYYCWFPVFLRFCVFIHFVRMGIIIIKISPVRRLTVDF